ncbi:peptidoglycan-binding domain-containing protein [Pontibaca salina]|uniref:Peptidoglycan-binding protein n=1 Tax=Pontibaca salina TaxID=2795731 RepID=A0A934HRA1_9RHOB|nr:peptidoglycan-binding domain-containing protein [Pontibaca salina]MBI6630007.1 peptidoglycan-binding protein [Pontibaca salina]
MCVKKLGLALISASLIFIPVERVQAGDAGAALGGMLLGGIIVNEVHKNKQRQRAASSARAAQRSRTRSYVSSAQRAQNRQVQTALNYFGYNVGAVDGAIGRNTRAGVARYQGDMGYHTDGYLDDYERDFLINSYQRALASAHVAPYNAILASQGQRGLLRTYRNEQLGIATTPPPTSGPLMAVAPAAVPSQVPDVEVEAAQVPEAAVTEAGLPQFNFSQTARSVSDHCNEVNVLTASNGGITLAASVSDAEFALGEQFCLARAHAIVESKQITATIPDLTDTQIKSQCDGLTESMNSHVWGLENKSPDAVISETSEFLRDSGQPADQLIATGKVCLGVGYRNDDAKMALASAVLLSSVGQLGYAEAVSHHLRGGFGTAKASERQATSWMTQALKALNEGGVMAMGQSSERIAVLAAATGNDTAGDGATALPVFMTTK